MSTGARSSRSLVAWALTTGEAGMRTQARGLASAVADEVVEKTIHFKPLWRRAPAGTPFLLKGLEPTSDRLDAPWPDLVVSCGRRAGAVALALKRRSGGAMKIVHVQDPQTSPRGFDLIVAMPHDRVRGPNVLKVPTALHDIHAEQLAAAAAEWEPRLAHLPRPYIGVLLGGPTAKGDFDLAAARSLEARLGRLRASLGGTVLIVPSRRTPDAVVQHFELAAAEQPGFWTWTRSGDNPYRGVLALADRLVVTADSVSMVSEALATPHPVEVYMLELGARHTSFVSGLIEKGLVRPFEGEAAAAPLRPVLDASVEAAAAARALFGR